MIDRHTECECDNFTVHMQDTSRQSECLEVVESINQGATFVACPLLLVTVIHFTPLCFQIQTFLNTVRGNRCVFVIRISVAEPVDMISFRLEFLPFQRRKITSQINIIRIVAVLCESELFRKDGFEISAHIAAHSQHTEMLVLFAGIFYQLPQYCFQISCAYGHHISKLFSRPELEYQKVVDHCELSVV